MRIYHGSKKIVSMPICDSGNGHNDFGGGFYATESEELAREWAAIDEKGGFLNIYELDADGLNILDLGSDEYDLLSWVAMIIKNRRMKLYSIDEVNTKEHIISEYLPDVDNIDIIKGYRADNANFSYCMAFIRGNITLQDLKAYIFDSSPCEQLLLRTKKALEHIEFTETETVDGGIYYPRRMLSSPDRCKEDAISSLGELTEYITECTPEFSPDRFLHMFVISGYAERYEAGDPCIVSGLSGTELHHKVLEACGLGRSDWSEPLTVITNERAFHTGELLGYYQQRSGLPFSDIISHIPYARLLSMYDEIKDMEYKDASVIIDRKIDERRSAATKLQAHRKRLGLSQKALSIASGVNIRTLQQYEIGDKDISRAAAGKVISLSHALHCNPRNIL